ncbi:MAG: hypothetical protein NC395_11805 [Prevotella sp.]|nr:hypothetical protein [Prevotella sp.]
MLKRSDFVIKKALSLFLVALTACQFSACEELDTDSIKNAFDELVEELNETETTLSKKDMYENDTRPQKNGFNESTVQNVISGNYTIPVPDYFEENTPNEKGMDYRGYAETGEKTTMLMITSAFDDVDPATFDVLYDDKDNMVRTIKIGLIMNNSIDNVEFINYDIYETQELKGMSFNFTFTYDVNGITKEGKYTNFVFPSEKDNKWIYIVIMVSDNANYRYDGDFEKMLDEIKKNDNNSISKNDNAPIATTTPKSIFYSTNDLQTAKKGNSGVYSYRSRGGEYYIYYVIDFDEGYVYRFLDSDTSCDRLKIESGDLNDVIIVTYHDGDDTWSNGLHFKWKNQPDHLVLEDNNHFETDFYPTDLDDALKIRDKKKIIDY